MGATVDPYSPETPYVYGCTACLERTRAAEQPVECPECGAPVRDISVPRE